MTALTHVLRRPSALHAMLFAGGVLVIALISMAQPEVRRAGEADSLEAVVHGTAARQFEAVYDAQFPVRDFAVSLWTAIDLWLFNEARKGIVIGRDGWLYTDEEFNLDNHAARNVRQHLDLIAATGRDLAARGIDLLVAPVPAKASVYPEHLGRRQPPPLRRSLYADVLHDLRAQGLDTVDLLWPLQFGKGLRDTYLRTDTHWTPFGARRAADVIAPRVRRHLPAAVPATRYRTDVEPVRKRRGDLFNFLPLAPWFAGMLPPEDDFWPERTRPVARDGASALLGAAASLRIALVGTSYSAIPDWNFAGALRQLLGEDILNASEDGRGPFVPMATYLGGSDFRAAPPRIVIWEVPVRYLPTPTERSQALQQRLSAMGSPFQTH